MKMTVRKYEEALPLLQRVQAIYKETLPPGDMEVAGVHANLGIVCRHLKQ